MKTRGTDVAPGWALRECREQSRERSGGRTQHFTNSEQGGQLGELERAHENQGHRCGTRVRT